MSPPRWALPELSYNKTDALTSFNNKTDACSWPSSPLVHRAGTRPLPLVPCSPSPTTERESAALLARWNAKS